jgi:RNA polymerase sigma-70 factor (ECF subfamily)
LKPDDGQTRSKGLSEAGVRPEAAQDPAAAVRALVSRARTGDTGAFEGLVRLHQDRAYALALRITRSPADAEEVAQDAFVRAWTALPRFRGESSFGTWLHQIVARRALDRLATLKTRRGRETGVEEAERIPAAGTGRQDLETAARALRMERMVQALPASQRVAVTLYYYEGKSVEQVAKMLGLPENTVKTHLSRARAVLRDRWLKEGA